MAQNVCWHCGTLTHLPEVCEPYVVNRTFHGDDEVRVLAGLFRCQSCNWPVIGVAVRPVASNARDDEWWQGIVGQYEETPKFAWYPKTHSGKSYVHVPQHIAEPASEAHECHSIGAYRGSQAIARAVVEATAKDKGITTGDLYKKIEAMEKQNLIRPLVREAADEVRLFGNAVAHGDFADAATVEESAQALVLMDEVLEEVYEAPGRLAVVKAARAAKASTP